MTHKFPGTPAETKVAEFLVASTGGHFVTIFRPKVGELLGVGIRGETVVIRDLMATMAPDVEPVKTAPAVAVKALVTEEMVAKAVEAMSSRDITFKYCDKNWQKYAIRHAIEAALSAQVQDVEGRN